MTEPIIMSFKWTDTKTFMKWTLTKNGKVRLTTEDGINKISTKNTVNTMRRYFLEDVACVMYFNPNLYRKVKE